MKTTLDRRIFIGSLTACLAICAAPAQATDEMNMSSGTAASVPASASQQALSDGVVNAVDPGAATLTIEHGMLANIGMPAMTMTYKVADPAMLLHVKTGDHIKFRVENVQGTLTVVALKHA